MSTPCRAESAPALPANQPGFIFLDRAGRRWPRIRLALTIGGLLMLAGIVLFIQSLFIAPWLRLPSSVSQLKAQLKALQQPGAVIPPPTTRPPKWLKFKRLATQTAKSGGPPAPSTRKEGIPIPGSNRREIRLGYYVGWDNDSLVSLATHADQLTHVCVERLTVRANGRLEEKPDPSLDAFAAEQGLVLVPQLSNLGAGDRWLAEPVENYAIGEPALRAAFVKDVVKPREPHEGRWFAGRLRADRSRLQRSDVGILRGNRGGVACGRLRTLDQRANGGGLRLARRGSFERGR